MSDSSNTGTAWTIAGIAIIVVIVMGFQISSKNEEISKLNEDLSYQSQKVDDYQNALEEANSNIDDQNSDIDSAKGSIGGDYDEMVEALESLSTANTISEP